MTWLLLGVVVLLVYLLVKRGGKDRIDREAIEAQRRVEAPTSRPLVASTRKRKKKSRPVQGPASVAERDSGPGVDTSAFASEVADPIRRGIFAVVMQRLISNIDASDEDVFGALVAWREQHGGETERLRAIRDSIMPLSFLRRHGANVARAIRRAAAIAAGGLVEDQTDGDERAVAEATIHMLDQVGLPVDTEEEEEARLIYSFAHRVGSAFAERCRRSGLEPKAWARAASERYAPPPIESEP